MNKLLKAYLYTAFIVMSVTIASVGVMFANPYLAIGGCTLMLSFGLVMSIKSINDEK